MRNIIQLVLFVTALRGLGDAQDIATRPSASERDQMIMREFVTRQLEGQRERAEVASAERQDERFQERQFMQKANAFVRMWTEFAKTYNEKQAFDATLASKLTRAFHELETSTCWPHPARRNRTPSKR
jgi:hypothetical protein